MVNRLIFVNEPIFLDIKSEIAIIYQKGVKLGHHSLEGFLVDDMIFRIHGLVFGGHKQQINDALNRLIFLCGLSYFLNITTNFLGFCTHWLLVDIGPLQTTLFAGFLFFKGLASH